MPGKASRKKRNKGQNRHDPLEKSILDSLVTGKLKKPKAEKKEKKEKEVEDPVSFMTDRLSSRIIKQVHEQQAELAEEDEDFPALGAAKPPSAWGKPAAAAARSRTAANLIRTDDSDEEEEELLNVDLEEEIEDIEITEEQERDLSMFMPNSNANRRTLADIIMDKIKENQEGDGKEQGAADMMEDGPVSNLEPKVVEVYSQVGKYLSQYTSGKVPKAFKIIPSLRDWEEILHLTNPEEWTPQAMFVGTRLFASNLNSKMAQRFYNLVLLPRVRDDIAKMKRLNYHLYASIKKCIYKPAAFFRGILLPLAQEECSVREALIMSSILSKNSIPAIHASVALLKLSQMEYSGPVVLFMKTLLNKKYSLPYRVIDGLVAYFSRFEQDEREMPVVWHQNLLTFVQRYKADLTPAQKSLLKSLMRKQQHKSITAEVRRELFSQAPSMVM